MTDLAHAMGGTFEADKVEITDFSPVPEGEYAVAITGAELKGTSKGGTMLVLDFSIMTGPNEGRVIYDRLNINCPGSEKAENIAKQSLAKICKAIDTPTLKSTNELLGKRLKIKVSIRKGEGTYIDKTGAERQSQDQNDIKGYYSLSSNGAAAPLQQTQPVQPAPQAAAPSGGTPPWAK